MGFFQKVSGKKVMNKGRIPNSLLFCKKKEVDDIGAFGTNSANLKLPSKGNQIYALHHIGPVNVSHDRNLFVGF